MTAVFSIRFVYVLIFKIKISGIELSLPVSLPPRVVWTVPRTAYENKHQNIRYFVLVSLLTSRSTVCLWFALVCSQFVRNRAGAALVPADLPSSSKMRMAKPITSCSDYVSLREGVSLSSARESRGSHHAATSCLALNVSANNSEKRLKPATCAK